MITRTSQPHGPNGFVTVPFVLFVFFVSFVPAMLFVTHHAPLASAQEKTSSPSLSGANIDVLLSEHQPSLLELVRIVRLFNQRDATVREAAIRRLLPFPKAAASAVVNALRDGNLSSRLAAYELLDEWKSPLGELDPWSPETLTDAQFTEIEQWLSQIDAQPAPGQPRKLSDEQLQTARQDIELMLKADPSEAAAVRERIARLGKGVLPDVLARLQEAATDEDRERLVTLRYRLAAGDALVLAWPGGLERLADSDPAIRHRAAEELAAMASASEQPLLLELFSDADSLVREISLRGLRNVGGEQATAALVQLLNDPEPNVRAAVLKQLAEDSSTQMLNEVAAYVQNESDADLVVHAIRYFRETRSSQTVPTLLSLLEHDSWQVRAEAAEAIGKILDNSRYSSFYDSSSGPDNTVEIYDALLELLADTDAFVVSRALDALSNVDAKRAVEPLVNAAAAHPTLAPQIVDLLAGGSQMRDAAVPHLREFFAREDPAVRAAAIRGLCQTDPDHVRDDLIAAVGDRHTQVRTAAAAALLDMLAASRPAEDDMSVGGSSVGGFFKPSPFKLLGSLFGSAEAAPADATADDKPQDRDPEAPAASDTDPPTSNADAKEDKAAQDKAEADKPEPDNAEPAASPLDIWLDEVAGGKHRPEWMSELVEPLRAMLSADEAQERLAAALVLIPLGDTDRALPVLLAAAAGQPALFASSAQALTWLPWERRPQLYWQLYEMAGNDSQRTAVIAAMNEVADGRAAALYWQTLDRADATRSLAATIQAGLRQVYFDQRYYSESSVTAPMRKRAVADVGPQLLSGPPLKRLVAIDLLLQIAPEAAGAAAGQLMDDASADEALRSDAFQITLAAQTSAQRTAAAIEALAGADVHRRRVAIRLLALGPSSLAHLPATGFTIALDDDGSYRSFSSGQPIIPAPPRGLEARHVVPLIGDADEEIAACAGYLLALFQDSAGLEPLLRHWRRQPASDDWDRLVYRAIAALDDASHIQILKQIYGRLDEHSKSEFYWTIRILSGEEMLAFRKQIRDEVGMSNLR